MFAEMSAVMEWFHQSRGSALPIRVNDARKKDLQAVHCKKNACDKIIASQIFRKRKAIKATRTNTYAKLGYVNSSLLDASATSLFQNKNNRLQVLRGLKDHSFKAYDLKAARRNAYAGGGIFSCSRNEQKSVGMRVQIKRKPRSGNLGCVRAWRPSHKQISLKEYLSWIRKKAMLFLSKVARHLYLKQKQKL